MTDVTRAVGLFAPNGAGARVVGSGSVGTPSGREAAAQWPVQFILSSVTAHGVSAVWCACEPVSRVILHCRVGVVSLAHSTDGRGSLALGRPASLYITNVGRQLSGYIPLPIQIERLFPLTLSVPTLCFLLVCSVLHSTLVLFTSLHDLELVLQLTCLPPRSPLNIARHQLGLLLASCHTNPLSCTLAQSQSAVQHVPRNR